MAVNRKFTPNRIRGSASRIFNQFSPMQNTRDLSRTDAVADLGCAVRNGRGINSTGRGRVMFFLLRMAFWLGLVLVLLPQGEEPLTSKSCRRSIRTKPYQAATAAASDMGQFCKRQPAGLRGRRPGCDRDRPARPGRRPQDLQDHHRQEARCCREVPPCRQEARPHRRSTSDKPVHTGSIDVPSAELLTRRRWRSNGSCRGRPHRRMAASRRRNRNHFRRFRRSRASYIRFDFGTEAAR